MAKIVTITNPLTGQPAQVDQLDHTAQQIDDGLNIARGVSNPNLFDNWYLANPVDQRQGRVVIPNTTYYSDNTLTTSAGTTSAYVTAYRYATGTAPGVNYASFKLTDSDAAPTYYAAPENVVRGYAKEGYTIDRLRMDVAGAVLIKENGVNLKVNGSIYGYSLFRLTLDGKKYAKGKTVALSVLTSLGFYSVSNVISDDPSAFHVVYGSSGSYVRAYFSGDNMIFETVALSDSDPDIIAVKLELGSQQTLAHQDTNGVWQLNEIPDYGEQLARCQRYFLRIGSPNKLAHETFLGLCSFYSTTNGLVSVPLPVTMRAGITAVIVGTFSAAGHTVDSVASVLLQGNSVRLEFHISDAATVGQTGYFESTSNGSYIDISADL